MTKNEIEARLQQITEILDSDTDRKKLESERNTLRTQLNTIRANEVLPDLMRKLAPDCHFTVKENGDIEYEVFRDRSDDGLSKQNLKKIAQAKWPKSEYECIIDELFDPVSDDAVDALVDAIRDAMAEQGIDPYDTNEDEHFIEDYIRDYLEIVNPDYYDQEVETTIVMNTGDANYDYTINSQYPGLAYNAAYPPKPGEAGYDKYDPAEFIPKEAGIAWLAETQGYTRKDLHEAFLDENLITDEQYAQLLNTKEPYPEMSFLQSMRWVMQNNVSATPCVIFLAKMRLDDFLTLNHLIKRHDREPDADCGTITISKDTTTGLFDIISGAGSQLEIFLEKDIQIPVKFIRSATPDIDDCCGIPYCVGKVYDLHGSAWKRTVKEVKDPAEEAGNKEKED